jgi:hypothetical protein
MKKLFFTAVALLTLSATTCAMAQVTVGSTANPQEFSVLELVSGGTRGLRLPQLTTSEREALTLTLTGNAAAQGLQIFNTSTECVETWNGSKWIMQCGDYVKIPVPTCTGMNIPPVRFAKFNLGADPNYDTPKKQMEYLANKVYSTKNERDLDARVNGGLFQWGRKWNKTSDATSYPVSVSGSYVRYTGPGSENHAADMTDFTLADNYDDFGQPKTNIGDHLYDSKSNSDHQYDWLVKNVASNLWDANLGMAPGRWGNGFDVLSPTPEGGIYYDDPLDDSKDGFYQNPVKTVNDPCPDGFRVPTQDEWERICEYGCNPSYPEGSLYGEYYDPVPNIITGKGLTWIPVDCNSSTVPGKCIPSTAWTGDLTQPDAAGGFAIYETEVWNAAHTDYKNGVISLHHPAAPEPLLYLPAAGYRGIYSGTPTDGSITNFVGNHGYYWSSTVGGTGSFSLKFTSNSFDPSTIVGRRAGLSVRCVVE